jgi:hypothetical protein
MALGLAEEDLGRSAGFFCVIVVVLPLAYAVLSFYSRGARCESKRIEIV